MVARNLAQEGDLMDFPWFMLWAQARTQGARREIPAAGPAHPTRALLQLRSQISSPSSGFWLSPDQKRRTENYKR